MTRKLNYLLAARQGYLPKLLTAVVWGTAKVTGVLSLISFGDTLWGLVID
jgi:hypothetical protein